MANIITSTTVSEETIKKSLESMEMNNGQTRLEVRQMLNRTGIPRECQYIFKGILTDVETDERLYLGIDENATDYQTALINMYGVSDQEDDKGNVAQSVRLVDSYKNIENICKQVKLDYGREIPVSLYFTFETGTFSFIPQYDLLNETEQKELFRDLMKSVKGMHYITFSRIESFGDTRRIPTIHYLGERFVDECLGFNIPLWTKQVEEGYDIFGVHKINVMSGLMKDFEQGQSENKEFKEIELLTPKPREVYYNYLFSGVKGGIKTLVKWEFLPFCVFEKAKIKDFDELYERYIK